MRSTTVVVSFLWTISLGCGGEGAVPDGGGADAQADAGAEADAATDAATSDAGPTDGLPATCEGSCQELSVTLTFGAESASFDQAFYGLTTPAAGGTWRAHIELHAGGGASCPTEASPPPHQTIVVDMPLPTTTDPARPAVSLLDFEGRFLAKAPVLAASGATARAVAANVCTDCVGSPSPSHPEGFIALDLETTFEGGEAAGHVYATHCDSMDL